MFASHHFAIATEPIVRASFSGSLGRLFEMATQLLKTVNIDVLAGRLQEPVFLRGVMNRSEESSQSFLKHLESLRDDYPIELTSPFEGVSTISGGIWLSAEMTPSQSAILKLHFQAGTVDLPFHSHDHSDRVVIVLDGHGEFLFSSNSNTAEAESNAVSKGDILVFTRGMTHTFRNPDVDLVLLSLHSPFIPLDDPRQYSIAE